MREILHQVGSRNSVDAVTPERDGSPDTPSRSIAQDFHLFVFVDRQRRATIDKRGSGGRGIVRIGQRPVCDSRLPQRKLSRSDGMEIQHLTHGNNAAASAAILLSSAAVSCVVYRPISLHRATRSASACGVGASTACCIDQRFEE